MNEVEYAPLRSSINFSDNPTTNFVSFVYDENKKVVSNGKEVEMKYVVPYRPFFINGNPKKVLIQSNIFNFVIVIAISTVLSFLQSAVVVVGFLPLNPSYWKYLLFQMTFISTMLGALYNLIWSCFSKNKIIDEYGKRGTIIASVINQKSHCSFQVAKESVINVLTNNHIFHSDKEVCKNLPYGIDYLNKLVEAIKTINSDSFYKYEHDKTFAKIANKGSFLFAIVCLILSILVELFSFIDVWNSVEDTFHNNMIASAILIPIIVLVITLYSISVTFKKYCIYLDAIYCLYSYQFLSMPYGSDYISATINISKYIKDGATIDESLLTKLNKTINNSYYFHITYRDIVVIDSKTIRIYGITDSHLNDQNLKEKLDLEMMKPD